MAGCTSYAQKKLLDHLLGITNYPMPDAYCSLHTADPTEAGSRTGEVSTATTGYERQSLDSAMAPTDLSTGISVNTDLILFGPATSDWGILTHIGIDDDLSSGSMLMYGQSSDPKLISTGGSFQLATDQLTISFD